MVASSRVTVHAPAKINLALHVTGRRPDNYHLIDTLAVFTRFGDRVTVTPAEQDLFTTAGPFATGLPAAVSAAGNSPVDNEKGHCHYVTTPHGQVEDALRGIDGQRRRFRRGDDAPDDARTQSRWQKGIEGSSRFFDHSGIPGGRSPNARHL